MFKEISTIRKKFGYYLVLFWGLVSVFTALFYLLGVNILTINSVSIIIISSLTIYMVYIFFFKLKITITIILYTIAKTIIFDYDKLHINIARTIFKIVLVSKAIFVKNDKRKQINNSLPKGTSFNSFIDSYIIDCIYAFVLSILGGLIFFMSTSVSKDLGILIIVFYYIIEVCGLFYGERNIKSILDGKMEKFGSWQTLPTLGIMLSSPLLLAYFLIRIRDLNYVSSSGLLKIWVISRYLITHPKLPEFNRKDDKTLRKLMQLKVYSDTNLTIKVIDPAKVNS
jgi:hypothetical protein